MDIPLAERCANVRAKIEAKDHLLIDEDETVMKLLKKFQSKLTDMQCKLVKAHWVCMHMLSTRDGPNRGDTAFLLGCEFFPADKVKSSQLEEDLQDHHDWEGTLESVFTWVL